MLTPKQHNTRPSTLQRKLAFERQKADRLAQVEAEVRAALKPRGLPIRTQAERDILAQEALNNLSKQAMEHSAQRDVLIGQPVVTEDELHKLRGKIPKIGTKHHICLNPIHFRIKYHQEKFPDLRSEDLWRVIGYSTKRVNYVNERTGLQISLPKAEYLPLTIWRRLES